MIRRWTVIVAAALFAGALRQTSAQSSEFVILEIERENTVAYVQDIADTNKLATSSNMVDANLKNFTPFFAVADIVSVNGRPAKGLWVARGQFIMHVPAPVPGQGIADIARGSVALQNLEILQSDGTPVGSIMISGFPGGISPPGVPPGFAWNLAVTGGTGAFVGAKGMFLTSVPFSFRAASVEEDPANRRTHGGPRGRFVVYLIPMTRPEIAATSSGPAVFHSDFSMVTSARPARTGETLILRATGLGPTRPGITPGTPFPQDPLQEINSPVDVMVNGRLAEVVNKIGWPGTIGMYRVDFRVPGGTPSGMAALQLSAAFVPGREVSLPVQ